MVIKINKGEKVNIICEGGWKYTGSIIENLVSPTGNLLWVKIQTDTSKIIINSKYIVSIISK